MAPRRVCRTAVAAAARAAAVRQQPLLMLFSGEEPVAAAAALAAAVVMYSAGLPQQLSYLKVRSTYGGLCLCLDTLTGV